MRHFWTVSRVLRQIVLFWRLKTMSRVLFASYHNYLDLASGAAISTRALLRALARKGHEVHVFCGTFLDSADFGEETVFEAFERLGTTYKVDRYKTSFNNNSVEFRLVTFEDCGVRGFIFIPSDAFARLGARYYLSPLSGSLFYRLLEDKLKSFRPDVFTAYGGDPRLSATAKLAKEHGSATVFFLHNLAYRFSSHFLPFDSIVVPSAFASVHYQKTLGLHCEVIPPLIEEEKIIVEHNDRRFVTFVNPTLEKGRDFFLGIARNLERARPEIPLLVVDARGKADVFGKLPEARGLTNLYRLETTDDPRSFYSQSRIVLVPSLCQETFGRVAIEAAFNAIPALCSSRGALPEVVGDSRLILDIPERLTPTARTVPSHEETAPWVEAIIKLWSDYEYACEIGERFRLRSTRYAQSVVEETISRFFETLVSWNRRRVEQ